MSRQRLQKILASRGIASRRGAEALIERGEVTVNGRVAKLGESADDEADDIRVGRAAIGGQTSHVYVALHKPAGVISSTVGRRGETTVLSLVGSATRLYPVGRLDRDTTGLLLLTNDGDWANLVTHPRFEIPKEYEVAVNGRPEADTLARLRAGLPLADGSRTSPALIEVRGETPGGAILKIVLHEGRKRQIRLMLAAVGHPVSTLQRTRVGPIFLGELAVGQWRELSTGEVQAVRDAAASPVGRTP